MHRVTHDSDNAQLIGHNAQASAGVDEPVLLSAPLAFAWAADLCADRNCGWYHGAWQYFRLLELVSTPHEHRAFFLDVFSALARSGNHRRILICGSADYSMLAHLLWAYQREGAIADVTIVDICETPLALNRWYAERVQVAVHTQRSDILDYHALDCFDVVCTHSFLGNIVPEDRPALVAKWHQLLRAGGKLVTINRIRALEQESKLAFKPQEACTFEQRVLYEAGCRGSALGVEPEWLAVLAREYTERKGTHPVRSQHTLAELFSSHGFKFDRFHMGRQSQPARHETSGPGITGQAHEYVEIVAMRI